MEKQTLFLPFLPDSASVRSSWMTMLPPSVRIFNHNLEVKKKGTNTLLLQTLFLLRQTKLPWDALMVVEEGRGSAHAPLGEMCYSCLCGCLCSHGNHLSPLLFLKSTCLWEYHSGGKKTWCILLLFWRLAKSIPPAARGILLHGKCPTKIGGRAKWSREKGLG